LIWFPNFHKNCFFSVKSKEFLFNITFWQKFYYTKKKNAQKIRENVVVDKKGLTLYMNGPLVGATDFRDLWLAYLDYQRRQLAYDDDDECLDKGSDFVP
jgi:hypothetical protein